MKLKLNFFLIFSIINTTAALFLLANKSEKILTSGAATTSTKFHLFTQRNANHSQQVVASNITQSLMNLHHPFRFIIHGWRGEYNQTEILTIKDAYLEKGDFNVIMVDWSFASSALYVFLTSYIKHIGFALGKFIKDISEITGISCDSIYIIGFSIGAHIAGIAGRTLHPEQINTIFGLDAAGPVFDDPDFENKLKRTDAKYVETIHTNIEGGLFPLGHAKPIGTASFYPAYGGKQPGCYAPLCSHGIVREYFAESINSDIWFVGRKCQNYEEIENKSCTGAYMSLMGGEPSRKFREGIYYVYVGKNSPFGQLTRY